MSQPIIFRRLARAEHLRSVEWYEDQQPGLGADFDAKVEAVLQIVANQPRRYPIVERDIREANVDRFPYCIYYRIRPNHIEVLAVFHQSRDPREWQSRA